MKSLKIIFRLPTLWTGEVCLVTSILFALMAFSTPAEAQFLKKLGKKAQKAAERGVERTVERKTEQKAEEKTDDAIESVFGIPKKVTDKEKTRIENTALSVEGTWNYEKLEGIPGYEILNDCNKKSNIAYSGSSYHTQFYDSDCNLLSDSGGSYELNGRRMTVYAENKDGPSTTKITTTQTILEHTESKLIIRDEMTGAVVTLVRR